MSASALVILQARVGSQRLPGKVLASLAGAPLVEYCLVRLRAAGVGPVVLATTTRPEDAALLGLAERLGIEGIAGPVDDVLARFADVARRHPDAELLLRATGDNPFVDIEGPARVLRALEDGADYVVEEGLPLGAAVEGVRSDVLLQAQRDAATPYDREHVTPWVRRVNGVVRVNPAAPEAVRAPDLRLTVDTREDLAFVQRLAASLSHGGDPRLASLPDVIAAARRVPTREVA